MSFRSIFYIKIEEFNKLDKLNTVDGREDQVKKGNLWIILAIMALGSD